MTGYEFRSKIGQYDKIYNPETNQTEIKLHDDG